MDETRRADSLEEIFRMQRGFVVKSDLDRYPREPEARVSALCTAIVHEAVELQRLTNWKWWKSPSGFDEDAAREELIDVWHFVVQASIELGMEPEAVLKEYRRKNEINVRRQEQGY